MNKAKYYFIDNNNSKDGHTLLQLKLSWGTPGIVTRILTQQHLLSLYYVSSPIQDASNKLNRLASCLFETYLLVEEDKQ